MTTEATTTLPVGNEPMIARLQNASTTAGESLTELYQKRVSSALGDRSAFARHQASNLSEETVAKLKEEIERTGVKYIYYTFPLSSRVPWRRWFQRNIICEA